jgi:hypothetical protein
MRHRLQLNPGMRARHAVPIRRARRPFRVPRLLATPGQRLAIAGWSDRAFAIPIARKRTA